ncbi:pentaheme c-type cytochrome TorC [Pseudomonas sp. F1_0610]|uniref:pentaheme c-type cytochrome TorC n=1 Tax=Pseudomonas sp. F1_0610 TaxID=3114284 RepID=UPI0039C05C43
MFKLIKIFWNTISKPATKISLGVLTVVSFLAGIIFWGGFNTAMEVTNTEEFCTSCHAMRDNPYQELQGTIHWSNRSGVRAICSDCHVPHNWTDKIARKMQASNEVYSAIVGTIDTREKFLDRRLVLAQREWNRMSKNGSLECRNCHDYKSMDFSKMSLKAQTQMRAAAARNQSCIDCHKGIAHHLPEMGNSLDPKLQALISQNNHLSYKNTHTYYPIVETKLYKDPALTEEVGTLLAATPLQLTQEKDKALQVSIDAWRKDKGFGRVLYNDFGLNIRSAILEKDFAQSDAINILNKKEDDMTGLDWQQVKLTGWVKSENLTDKVDHLWDYAKDTYQSNCSVCHAQPAVDHFDANTWPGLFDGMVGFTNMNKQTQSLVLKYLQSHSSDFANKQEH